LLANCLSGLLIVKWYEGNSSERNLTNFLPLGIFVAKLNSLMEDLVKIIISIVAAILYFIFSSNKSIKQQQTRRPGKMPEHNQPVKPVTPPAKVSFEELLKELESKVEKRLPQPSIEETIEDRKYRNKKNVEAASLESPFSYDDKYQNLQTTPSVGEQGHSVKPHSSTANLSKPSKETATTSVINPLTELLTDKDKLRNAFVLSEIFNRKW